MQDLQPLELPFSNFPGFCLRVSSSRTMAELTEILSHHDIRIVEATLLILIWRNPGCLQRAAGDALNIASANLTPIIHGLSKKGWVRKQRIDGRSNGLFLTESGCSLAQTAFAEMQIFEEGLLRRIPKSLRAPFLEALSYLS